MNAISIIGVVSAFCLVFLWLLALCAEKGVHPFRRVRQGFRRLPAWEKTLLSIFVGVWIAFASVKDGGANGVNQVEGETNTVTQIEGTNTVGQTDGGAGTNGTGLASGPLMLGRFGRPNLMQGAPTVITGDDVAQLWRIDVTVDGNAFATPTANAVTNMDWRDYGGMSDSLRIKPDEWRFPFGNETTTGVTVFENGDFRPNVKTHFFPPPFDANLSLLPKWNWGLLPDGGESVFWHEHTQSNSLVLTWNNALYNRDINCPTNFQAELFSDGRFDYRYPDRTIQYAPVFPFDWDGDGLENSVDPEPLVAGFDAHGTTADWYDTVCSNVFTRVEQSNGQPIFLPNGESVYFKSDVNANAYYFVDVVAQHGPVLINFTADGPSNLGNPVVVAQAGENNRVPLLIGVQYVISSSTALSIVAPPEVDVNQLGEGGRYSVEWPAGLSYSLVDGVATPIVVEAGRLNGEFLWSGGCCTLQSGQSISFQCHHCGCGGCQANMDYLYEGYVLARPGPSCGCTGNDVTTETIPYVETASGASLELGFDKSAVIFENAYDNTPTNHVPLRSTEVVLKLRANGGIHGGTLVITTSKLSRLAIVSGTKPANESIVLAPYQMYEVVSTNRGALASTSLKDIEVKAELRENDGGDVARVHAALTSYELKLSADYVAPDNQTCTNRHVYGVGESVKFEVKPLSSLVTFEAAAFDPYGEEFSYNNTFGGEHVITAEANRTYTAPIVGIHPSPVKVKVAEVEYCPAMSFVEPANIICRWAGRDPSVPCLPYGQVGGTSMLTQNYVGPMHVSFEGIMLAEIPCSEALPATGYFASENYTGPRTHTPDPGAGRVRRVSPGNLWGYDRAGSSVEDENWSEGRMAWKIPIGWFRPAQGVFTTFQADKAAFETMRDENSRMLLIGQDGEYVQIFSIDENGTARIDKHGHWLSRSRTCVITLDGTVIQERHP